MILKGSAYVHGEVNTCYIGIDEERGKIDWIKKSYSGAEDVRKMKGIILPGGIDLHVHFRDPGMTKKEDFYSGSVSAANGGITTVLDMPNTAPPTDTHKRLEDKIKRGKNRSVIDFGLYGLVSEEAEDMCELTDFFKVYMSSTTGIDRDELKEGLKAVFDKGKKVTFHCEDEELFGPQGEDLKGYSEERPIESELSAIDRVSEFPEGDKRIAHITSKRGLEKAICNDFMTEVTPHHLFLNNDAFLGPFGKVNPPLRSNTEQLKLWEAMSENEISVIASDHAPHLEEEKDRFADAPAGIPGVETMYPLLLNSVSMGRISLNTLVEMIAVRPGEYLSVKKGRIEEGYDADLINVDLRDIVEIDRDDLHSKCGWSPFEGFKGIFPKSVISRGETIVDDYEFIGEKGRGIYIR